MYILFLKSNNFFYLEYRKNYYGIDLNKEKMFK